MPFPEGLSDKSRWTLKYGIDSTRDHFGLNENELALGPYLELLIDIFAAPEDLHRKYKSRTNLGPDKFHRFNQPVIELNRASEFANALGKKTPNRYFQVPERFVGEGQPQFSFVDRDGHVYTLTLDPGQVDKLIEDYIIVHETAKKIAVPKAFGHVQRLDGNITKYFVSEQDDEPQVQACNYSNTTHDWHSESIAMYFKNRSDAILYQFNYASGETAIGLSSENSHSVILTDRANAPGIIQPFREVTPQTPFKLVEVS